MQRLGGRLRGVVSYESATARAKFLIEAGMEWYIYYKRFQYKVLTENIFGACIGKVVAYNYGRYNRTWRCHCICYR